MAPTHKKGQSAPRSNLFVSTHVGRKEDQVGTLLMKIEDIKTKIGSAKPGEGIEGGALECGDMEFRIKIYPNGESANFVGNVSVAAHVKNRGKRKWKSVEFSAAENSTGAFLKTQTYLIEDVLKRHPHITELRSFITELLPHDVVLSEENSSFFPSGVLTVKVLVKIQGEETVTHTHTSLPDESITAFQLKGELSAQYRKMLEGHQFSDVRIICQEEIIPCHRNILAARSEIFEAMFEHNMTENKTREVEIKDFDFETVKSMILFIYTGEVEYNQDNAKQLIMAADKYALHGLKKKIEDALLKTVKIENAIDMFVLGDGVHADNLRDVSKEVIVKNAVAIVKIDGWKEALGRFHTLAMEILESLANSKDHTQ